MRHTREQYEAAVAQFRAFGKGAVTETDMAATVTESALRAATLEVFVPAADAAPMAVRMTDLAFLTDGYLTMLPWQGRAMFSLTATRDLAAAADPLAAFDAAAPATVEPPAPPVVDAERRVA
jgi:hypothetical protein